MKQTQCGHQSAYIESSCRTAVDSELDTDTHTHKKTASGLLVAAPVNDANRLLFRRIITHVGVYAKFYDRIAFRTQVTGRAQLGERERELLLRLIRSFVDSSFVRSTVIPIVTPATDDCDPSDKYSSISVEFTKVFFSADNTKKKNVIHCEKTSANKCDRLTGCTHQVATLYVWPTFGMTKHYITDLPPTCVRI